MYTKLEAVNYLLDVLGSPPVSDLESLHPDVLTSIKKLEGSDKTLQKLGLWFNKELNVELTPDINDEIVLSNDVLKVISVYENFVIQRGSLLYDTVKNSYKFDQPIHVDYVVLLEWELLPFSVQDCIVFHAAMQVAGIDLEDQIKRSEQKELYIDALLQVKKEDLEIKRRNVLNTPQAIGMRSGVRPYRLRSSGFNPIFPGG